jgi:integrase
MSGTVKHARLESRTSRARLKRGREPHYKTLVAGRAHLGYQRQVGAVAGRWILRQYIDRKYKVIALGAADDVAEATGEHVLSFEQAEAAARAILDRPGKAISRLTVRRAMELYTQHKASLGQSTVDLVSRTNAHILPLLGDRPISELSAKRLRDWMATIAAMSPMLRTRPDAPQQYRPEATSEDQIRARRASANRVWTMLRAALNFVFHEGLVASDIEWRKVKPFKGVQTARLRYLSVAEAQRLINASDPEFRGLLIAALTTGARFGELIRLRVSDYNPDAATIAIHKSKSGKPRYIQLNDEGADFFRQHCAGKARAELMFTHADASPWGPAHQGRPMREACAKAKIDPPMGFHGLRHSHASAAVMNGMPLLVLARNLGHRDERMVVQHYGHLSEDYIAETIKAHAPRFGLVGDKKIVPVR